VTELHERLLIVDAANVVGSVPNGWWRDRAGAAERLRDALAGARLPGEVILVVEGRAGKVRSVPGVEVVSAHGSGDDTIVDLVRRVRGSRPVNVVTADRELRERVSRLGASLTGPRDLRARIGY